MPTHDGDPDSALIGTFSTGQVHDATTLGQTAPQDPCSGSSPAPLSAG